MKTRSIRLITSTLIAMTTLVTCAQMQAAESVNIREATYIPLSAKVGQDQNLSVFLSQGANLVAKTEPNTVFWYALKKANGGFGIFDFFPNEAGRAEHFAGKVAAALKNNSDKLVAKGWQQGVLDNVNNFSVLSYKAPRENQNATVATYIKLQAQVGKEQALENLLVGAAGIVDLTEPETVLWAALKLNKNTYGIFDTFTDSHGRQAHFSGKVAAALKAQANSLIVGGWEDGVLKNIHNFEIIAEAKK
ncbi:MAG: hypothetical protein ACRBBR_16725 [Cellvibrionaceae bacterium]